MSKKKELEKKKDLEKSEEKVVVKAKKKKKTPYQRRKVLMQVFGAIMAIVMILGTLLSIFGMLWY